MSPDQLLERIAATLRRDIGPAIGDEYPRTQAFMAAVVLQKLGRGLACAPAHRAAAAADMDALVADLEAALAAAPPPSAIAAAVAGLERGRDAAALCALIEALYANREALDPARFDTLLSRVRRTLRADIDRRVEVAA
ncbi:hypothetical protein [Vineibacter terrae]|uniref:hypothetical protein n=1 Tax=Vineibacter terrae TaxID=2586908 RepID=UPI002E3790C2|nr:hypothetical protein [Vineibacter terrae]HEX2886219.1 hypothetical protein [Vineibacter terrae]